MVDLQRRHVLASSVAVSLVGFAGLSVYRNRENGLVGDRPEVVRKSKTGNKQWELVDGQPELDAGHGRLWAYLVNSKEADEKVHWDRWPTSENNPAPRVSDFSKHVIVVLVGIVKPGYELDETSKPVYERNAVTHTYTISETERKYQNAADLSNHYDIIRWKLNDHPAPKTVELVIE